MNSKKSVRVRARVLPLVALVAAVALVTAGCSDKKKAGATQVAAKVNKEEISVHQINFVLEQQRNLRPDQAEAAGRQVLERLIDQELAVQRAEELKIDRDPRVVQALAAARRDVVARAYAEKLGEGAARPTPEEVKAYYEAKPALFKDRRIYNIQELQIDVKPEQQAALRAKLDAAKNLNEFIEYLKANDFHFTGNQAVRPAEQLPLAALDRFAQLKDGDSLVSPMPNGLQVIYLAGSRPASVDLERAKPAIEQFLLNERKRDLVAKDLKELRAGAKIEYVGKFAEGRPAAGEAAASAPAATPATAPVAAASAAPAPAPAPAASSGLDASAISKGMGLK